MKLGTDTPITAINIAIVSPFLPRLTAANAPKPTPPTVAKMSERIPNSNEYGKASVTIVRTGRLEPNDVPKSP